MNAIAEALVYAVTYINLREDDTEDDEGDDVGALESIAAILQDATEAEKDALAAAAEKALAEEQSDYPREEVAQDFRTWMEDMFGDEEWKGNHRRD